MGIRIAKFLSDCGVASRRVAEDIIKSIGYANEVSQASGLPVVMTSVKRELYDGLKDKIDNLLPLTLQAKPV